MDIFQEYLLIHFYQIYLMFYNKVYIKPLKFNHFFP